MQEAYVVQSAIRYMLECMIPVPEDFTVHPDYLFGGDQADFIAGFRELHAIAGQIYDDMRMVPAGYGLPLYEFEKYPQFSKERNSARHAAFRLGNLFYNLGRAGELSLGELVVDLEQYKAISKDKTVPNAPMILNQMGKFGFELTGFNGKSFDKGAKEFCMGYPDNQHLMTAFKAFSMTVSPEHHDNRHRINKNFYLFHYRLFSEYTGEAPGSDLPDFIHAIGTGNRPFFDAFHRQMVQNGYEARYSKSYEWKLDYFKNNKYSYHFCQKEDDDFLVRLKLSNVRAYTDFLDSCPERIQRVFVENPPCHRCKETCALRIEYELGEAHHESCACEVFLFHHPKAEELEIYLKLIELEEQAIQARKN